MSIFWPNVASLRGPEHPQYVIQAYLVQGRIKVPEGKNYQGNNQKLLNEHVTQFCLLIKYRNIIIITNYMTNKL